MRTPKDENPKMMTIILQKSQKNIYAYTSSAIRLFESINLLKKSVTQLKDELKHIK